MKKKSLIIIVVIVIIAILGLMIAINSKPTNTNKEDNKANNTEASQTESESLTENTEETTEIVKDHDYYYDENGKFDRGWDEAGITRAEDAEDGILGFKVMYNDDGTTYLLYNKDGSRYDLLDILPDGSQYTGKTPEDEQALIDIYMGRR